MVHGNARLAPKGRWEMVKRVLVKREAVSRVARDMGVSRETVYKWVRRYEQEGWYGLLDRSSRPHSSPGRASPETERAVVEARRRLRAGPARIAAVTGAAERTITRILRRNGVLRLWDCDPLTGEPKQSLRKGLGIRYEHPYAGDLLHMDTKKIAAIPPGGGWAVHGRGNVAQQGVGYIFVHSIVDDHTRLAYSQAAPRREGPHRGRVPHPGVGELPATRHPPCSGDHDRQPLQLQTQPPVQGAPQTPRDQTHNHQALQPATEREGGTLPTNPETRMGQPTGLARRRNQDPSPPRLAPLLQ